MTETNLTKYKTATIRVEYPIYRPEKLKGFLVNLINDDDERFEHGYFPTLGDAATYAEFNSETFGGLCQSVRNFLEDKLNPDKNLAPAVVLDSFYPDLKVASYGRVRSTDFFSQEDFSVGMAHYANYTARVNGPITHLFEKSPLPNTDFFVLNPKPEMQINADIAKKRGVSYAPLFEAILNPEKIVLLHKNGIVYRLDSEAGELFGVSQISVIVLDKKRIDVVAKLYASKEQSV